MKRHFLILLLALLGTLAYAYPVRIASWNPDADLKTLNALHVSVDFVNRNNGIIIAYVHDDNEFASLLDSGFAAAKLPDPAPENARRLHQDSSKNAPKDEYYTITQYNQFMQDTAAQFPNICSLVQIGSSVQGRPLYFLKITDNPGLEEAEPEFKYISSIHGDEVVGYDMCIRLIQQLTSEYGTNPRITNLVDNTEIWICPMMNPDGFVLGQRYNANGVDLNRNYPMPFGGNQHPDGNAWAQENVAMMDFCNGHLFVLSANFHGGALVANYPWDYTYTLAPDNDLLIQAALTYTIHNPPMYNSTEFDQGITNGAAWYVITGSMQDWNYGDTDCMDITMEIGHQKWPPASQLPTFWAQNQESMLSYMEFVHRGIHGLVTSDGGTPLNASITVQGNAKVMHTDPDVGDFHRLLLPGTYTVTASAAGYLPQTAEITVPASGSVQHDFVLNAAQAVDLIGQLRDLDGFGIPGVTVSINTEPVSTATADANGCFQFAGVPEGQYQISFSSGSQIIHDQDFLLTLGANRLVFIVLEPQQAFYDPCENISNWTASGPWAAVTYQSESVITDSPAGNYSNNTFRTLRITDPISLQNIAEPTLSFKTVYDLESGYDFVLVQASTSTSNWTDLGSLTGTQGSWQTLSYSLEQFAGQSVYVRFALDSDWSVNGDGIYLDDITISGIGADQIIYGDVDGDRLVSVNDAQAVIDHNVGFDPLPDIDPLPWTAERVTAADVDQSLVLDSEDAWLIGRYLLDPPFRFQAQSGEEALLPAVTLEAQHIDDQNFIRYQVSGNPAGELRCVDWQLLPADGFSYFEASVAGDIFDGLSAYNPQLLKYAHAQLGGGGNLSFTFQYNTALPGIDLCYNANGQPGLLNLPSGVANADEIETPVVFSLQQNYPNPFNPSTSIVFSLPEEGPAWLGIYNTRGQLVKTLLNGPAAKGTHQLVWDGRDSQGKPVSSGIYLYKLVSGAQSQTRRMILVK
ncbi:MAG: M14 family zinc carboxypeptidase [Candidatus Cloacimonetes bacterium]|nr:carboxypeptidase regulatory-like domain-containing protein [Candidatus Cloacimonadota bacterium]MDD4223500.1 M14 family zinc carboxypeptidase [Candidatus Cloacimonadota bacterium]